MHTVHDRLLHYCKENNAEMPFGAHPSQIGTIVAKVFKELHSGEEIGNATIELEVNAYPNIFLPTLDGLIAEYFKSRHAFLKKANKSSEKSTKAAQFNYEVHKLDAADFEKALAMFNIPVTKNEALGSKSWNQYIISSATPYATLINLGRKFNKLKTPRRR